MLVAVPFCSSATGTFSSRKLEKATYDSIAYRYLCANTHPDHDTIASFRKRFLKELEAFFVKILLIGQAVEQVKLGTVNPDRTRIKANASGPTISRRLLPLLHACSSFPMNSARSPPSHSSGTRRPSITSDLE